MTEIIKLDKKNIDLEKIKKAAEVIKNGGLVAFPTETVYGLGANALDGEAIKKIFLAKGRPSDNPLIVHISDIKDLAQLAVDIDESVYELLKVFWPGALTVVLKKSSKVPFEVSAGLDTVAIRMPSHTVALSLINHAKVPIAAPSANTSGKPSPTIAKHVISDLMGKIDIIIDAGSAKMGLESTVLDMTSNPPMILRPGGISIEQLRKVIPNVCLDKSLLSNNELKIKPKSPGMKYKHYSPEAKITIVKGDLKKVSNKILQLAKNYKNENKRVGILATIESEVFYKDFPIIILGSRANPETIAASLFKSLREFDEHGIEIILSEGIDDIGIGMAVMNRLNKAAGFNIIDVNEEKLI